MINQRKRVRKKILDLSEINSFDINLHSITADKIIEILQKSSDDRELKDYSILKAYILNISKIKAKFILDKIDDSAHEQIILLSLSSSKLKIINSNTIIYNPDKEANYLYIILRGSAKVLKLEKYIAEMNLFDYFKTLINFRNANENYLLAKTIEENNSLIPMDINDISFLEKILLKIYLLKHDERSNLDKILKKVGLNYSDFGLKYSYKDKIDIENKEIQLLNKKLLEKGRGYECKNLTPYDNREAKTYLKEQKNKIISSLDFISYETCQKYMFFIKNPKYSITLYKFKEDKILRNNDYFGDYLYGKYIHCVKSTQDELYLLMIKNTVFKEFAKNKKSKIVINQLNFLTDNFFFHSINL